MKISKEEVEHTAKLAKLKLDPTQLDKWCEDMGAIIEFANMLNELALPQCDNEAQSMNGLKNALRSDESRPSYEREKMLENAPERYDGCYVVPKIVE